MLEPLELALVASGESDNSDPPKESMAAVRTSSAPEALASAALDARQPVRDFRKHISRLAGVAEAAEVAEVAGSPEGRQQ